MKEGVILSETFTLVDSTTRIACRLVGYVFWPRHLVSRIRQQVSARTFAASAAYTVIATLAGVALCSWHAKAFDRLVYELAKTGNVGLVRSANIDWSGLQLDGLVLAFGTLAFATIVLWWSWLCPRKLYPQVRALFNVSFGISVGRAIVLAFICAALVKHLTMRAEVGYWVFQGILSIAGMIVVLPAIHLHAAYLAKIDPRLSGWRQLRLRLTLLVLVIVPLASAFWAFMREPENLISVRSAGQATFRIREKKYAELDLLVKKRDSGREPVYLILDNGGLTAEIQETGHARAQVTGRLLDGEKEVSTVELQTDAKVLTFRVPIEEVKEAHIFFTSTGVPHRHTLVENKFVATDATHAAEILETVNDQTLTMAAFVAQGVGDRYCVPVSIALHKQARSWEQ